jgi:DNA-binding transcriptional MerR regulator
MAARLSIGEFSMMTQLSRKALRHYHELGLLEPAYIDVSTGYRHYETAQVPTAQIIRRFRELGMPVPDVKAVLAATDMDARNEILAAHLQRMESRLAETRETVSALRDLLLPSDRPFDVEFRSVPATQAWAVTDTVRVGEVAAWFGTAMQEISAALAGAATPATGPPGGLYAPELFADEVGQATVFIPTMSTRETTGRVRVLEIPAAELAVTVHRGSHQNVDRTYGALGSYVAERLLSIPGPVRENYLDTDDGVAQTEICWPVFRTDLA